MKSFGKSVTGLVRGNNEDTIFVSESNVGALPNLFIVADGMGGHHAGEIASSYSVAAFCDYVKKNINDSDDFLNNKNDSDKILEIEKAINYANKSVLDKSLKITELSGMGTTFLAASIFEDNILIANVGDCRLYSIQSTIEQITIDHSYVMELVRLGKITEDEAKHHSQKNILTRALGTENNLKVDTLLINKPKTGYILLCSDGLTNMLSDDEIFQIVTDKKLNNEGSELELKVNLLIDSANEKGGYDNISVIIIKLGEEV